MIGVQSAFSRLRKLKAFAQMSENDFRAINYCQIFASLASGATSQATGQNFPAGAIVLGITASAFVPSVAAATGQSNRNRQLFGLNFSYTNNESLTPGGPISADALLGGGDDTLFPCKELVIAPNQQITAQAQNFSTSVLSVHIVYHCLVYRYGG